ncbi:MAG TPA: hypothetical protein VGV57_02245 [Thermoleophilaceae bacterium]|nr:hypothetical protein [Thermoleophilaceae bacterium]
MQAWARTPVRFTPLKSELLIRLLIADLVGEAPTRKSIAALREDIADLVTRIEETEAGTDALPHRRKYLLLVTGRPPGRRAQQRRRTAHASKNSSLSYPFPPVASGRLQ